MSPRDRNIEFQRPKGTWGRFGETFGDFVVGSGSSHCSDQTGLGDCAPLTINHVLVEGGIINKPNTSFFASWFNNYAADVYDNLGNFPFIGGHGEASLDAFYATQAAARTNPSRPYVDVPVNVLQLPELVSLIQRRGTNLVRELGRENLRYQFAIAPLVGDLVKLTRFHDQVARRNLEIERLRSPRGLRRTVDLFSNSVSGVSNKVVQSQGTFINAPFTYTETLNIRAHLRWLPDGPLAPSGSREMSALVKRAVTGLTPDFSTAWELIPFSWLADWAGGIGDYFQANRNIIPATLSGVHVMRHTRVEWGQPAIVFDDVSLSGAVVTREQKTRATSFIAPTAHFPYLSGNQMGILASLAVTRA